ncbi:MAG: FkbM family methyltransferase [Bacteroidia bacterium]|nr:FkbM family methyltransferase [Bacteroidia bacterium]
MYSVFKNKQDAFEIELLKKHIKQGDTVLDIGANIGFYATILSDIVGEKGKIHCFEPDTTNFNHLKKTTSSYKNIIINNKAVGPKTEKLKIYTSKELNVDHRTYKPEEYDQEIEIDAVSIDDYLKGEKVDFIKMDIQGFEMEAMKGMKETLKNNPKVKMISEFWPYGLRKSGSSLRDYFVLLKELNFNVEILKENKLETLDLETVLKLESLGEEHYFNILVTPNV